MFFILSLKIALFCTKQGSTMRLHRTLPQGSSLELTAFFMNRSLTSRMLMLGLPLLAFVLLIIFTGTGSSIEAILDRSNCAQCRASVTPGALRWSRHLKKRAISFSFSLLAPWIKKTWPTGSNSAAKAGGLRYRELAFEGLAPDNRYLLVNTGGDIINVPMRQALPAPQAPSTPLPRNTAQDTSALPNPWK